MAKERLSDKLAVILHADVAGSTQLVQQDEHRAHERIQDSFSRFSDTIKKYRGSILELRGDALLAEFERPSDAVTAALAFQIDQAYYLSLLKDDLKPAIRVGIAMGEVVMGDRTVTGAGVVLAQRVEQLADPGSLCVTAALHESLPNRMPFDLENIGEQTLKGFDEPVRVYRVELSPGASIPPPQQDQQSTSSQKPWQLRTAIAVGVVAIIIGIAYALKPKTPVEEPALIERMAFPLPDKPSIAVLPFTNMSGVAEQEYFADGITENLITDLSKISGLFIISRNSSFSYKGQQVKVRQVAEDLGVRYVLEGSVQRAGKQVRINAQLIDATTGGHLWADRYDGSLADIFALQDRVTTKITKAMSVTLTPLELGNIGSVGTSNAAAHDAYLQGLSFYLRSTPGDNAKAEVHFKHAIELDPDYKNAYAALAKVYYKGIQDEYGKALLLYWRKAQFLAHKNLSESVGAKSADGHILRSWMALSKHQLEVALQEAERALDFGVNNVDALKIKARTLIFSGKYAQGRNLADRIIRLDPAVIAEPLYLIGLSYFASERYDKAADYIERALGNDGAPGVNNLLLAATYGKLGMEMKAKEALLKYRETTLGPFWVAAAVFAYPFEGGEVLKNLADGFEAAGVVVRPPSRYLRLDLKARLTGQEIETLLFGHTIKGSDFWRGTGWGQIRTLGGKVSHSGEPIHIGIHPDGHNVNKGESWVEDDRLCNRWTDMDVDITNCVLIFRDLDGDQNEYYMVTDTGPNRFQVSN